MDQPTLLASQLVCREWHKTLQFLPWENLKLVQLGRYFKHPMDDDFIRQHAPSVQQLSIQVDPRQYQYVNGNLDESLCLRTVVFPKLTSLEIVIQNQTYMRSATGDRDYVTSNLFRLMLKSSSLSNGGGEGFRTLQVLKIQDFHFQYLPRDWMTLWETLWSRLQVLSLIGIWWDNFQIFEEEKDLEPYAESIAREKERSDELCDPVRMKELAQRLGPSSTIRDLTLTGEIRGKPALFGIQKWMVLQCPKLVRLRWSVEKPKEDKKTIMQLMQDAIVDGRQQDPPRS